VTPSTSIRIDNDEIRDGGGELAADKRLTGNPYFNSPPKALRLNLLGAERRILPAGGGA